MKAENVNLLDRLSLFCHISGVANVYLGILIVLMDLMNSDRGHICVGIFICTTGYSFTKISAKIARVVALEKKPES